MNSFLLVLLATGFLLAQPVEFNRDIRPILSDRCFACHGYDGQTGSPRLVPMARAEDVFLAYVRKPATPGMPSFAATPEQDLRDAYAYIRSIPQAAPPADSIPLLKGIVDRRTKTN